MDNNDRIKRARAEVRASRRTIGEKFACDACGETVKRDYANQKRCPPCSLLADLAYCTRRIPERTCEWCGDVFSPHTRNGHHCAPCQGAQWVAATEVRIDDWKFRHDRWAGHYGDDETAYNETIESDAAMSFTGPKPEHRPTGCRIPGCPHDPKPMCVRTRVGVCVYCASSADRRLAVLETLRDAQARRRTVNHHKETS